MSTNRPTVESICEATARRLVEAMETGQADPNGWRAPWHGAGAGWLPRNASTGKPYTGSNVMTLTFATEDKGYRRNLWATYKQWQSLGAQVLKGEKATYGVKWIRKDGDPTSADPAKRKDRMFPTVFAVFNVDQTDAQIPEDDEREPLTGRIAELDAWMASTGADIREGGNRAYYSRLSDHVQVPEFESFKTVDGFYATVAHELTHWTGGEARLGRTFGARFGDDAYAVEELTAELGAASIMALAGLSTEPRPDHAHYVANWCRVLRAEPKVLFTVSSAAAAAVRFLPELAGELVDA